MSAWAGDITDIYTHGDPLTVTTMDNVKAAVNSKQNAVTDTCPAGQSIRVINADGSVICQAARSVITVITTSSSISAGSFGCARSDCPVSHPIAIGFPGRVEDIDVE